ncbi:hypothetical protein Tco_1138749, partial [Tanacetum coccineum]
SRELSGYIGYIWLCTRLVLPRSASYTVRSYIWDCLVMHVSVCPSLLYLSAAEYVFVCYSSSTSVRNSLLNLYLSAALCLPLFGSLCCCLRTNADIHQQRDPNRGRRRAAEKYRKIRTEIRQTAADSTQQLTEQHIQTDSSKFRQTTDRTNTTISGAERGKTRRNQPNAGQI